MNHMKNTKGITLVALVITIIVLLILAGVTITTLIGDNGLITKAKDAKIATEIADIKERIQTDILSEQAGKQGSISDSSLKTILEKYGTLSEEKKLIDKTLTTTKGNYKIKVSDIFNGTTDNNTVVADGSWNGTVNTPKIDGTGLTAVYWNGTDWTRLTEESSQEEWNKWYDYSQQKWANAMSRDGSMWVWIPRYEYKIDSTNKTITVNFVKIGDTTTDGYTLHPAFSTDINNGGWSSELPGFWIAKYAAGYQYGQEGQTVGTVQYSDLKYTTVNSYSNNFLTTELTTDTNLSYPVFKANTYAYNMISVSDAYLLSKEIDGKNQENANSTITKASNFYGLNNIDSHLVKNSEWGAVAYLTHSQYGVDGNATDMNEVTGNNKNLNNDIYVNNDPTSGTKANVYAVTSYGRSNTPNDITASSTKNMTGVFDLNGCVWERVAGFYQGESSARNPDFHSAMATSSTTDSTKYLTLYTDYNKKGDATNETTGWNSDYSNFGMSNPPVFERGGSIYDDSRFRCVC